MKNAPERKQSPRAREAVEDLLSAGRRLHDLDAPLFRAALTLLTSDANRGWAAPAVEEWAAIVTLLAALAPARLRSHVSRVRKAQALPTVRRKRTA